MESLYLDNNIKINNDIPAGNIIVDDISENQVKLRTNHENSSTWWFWWHFAIDGAAGKTLTFNFSKEELFSSLGPCYSDGGDWQYLGADAVNNNSFTFKFPEDAGRYYFAVAPPYTQDNLELFLSANPKIKREELAVTPKQRKVELISLISEKSCCNVLLTARHHACEVSGSRVLEGIFEFWQADPYLQKYVDLRAVPFMDTDGVQDGDQGKNRIPHDHNRDYGPFIYAETKALIKNIPEWPRTVATLDLHCPLTSHTDIFMVGASIGQESIDEFSNILKQNQSGDVRYTGLTDIPYGTGWNVHPQERMMTGYLRKNGLSDMATVIEIPYAQSGKTTLTPDNLRQFGHDVGKSLKIYQQKINILSKGAVK